VDGLGFFLPRFYGPARGSTTKKAHLLLVQHIRRDATGGAQQLKVVVNPASDPFA
jgi:hypothetical protein